MKIRTGRTFAIAVLLVGALPAWGLYAAEHTKAPAPWTELRYRAQKLFLSATTTISLHIEPAAEARGSLRTPPQGHAIAPPGPRVAVITLDSDLPFGRREVASAWIDPSTGQVLQSEKRNYGHDLVWKLRRYTTGGVYTWRSEPRSPEEEAQEPAAWTGVDNAYTPWAEKRPPGSVVTDSYALLYLLSRARMDRPDRTLTVYLLSHDHLVEVRFEADDLAAEQVHFDEVRGSSDRERVEGVLVRRVTTSARRLGGGAEDVDVGILGLKNDLSFAVEVGTGLPVEISGRASGVGRVYVKLKKVVYRGSKTAPQTPMPSPAPAHAQTPCPTHTPVAPAAGTIPVGRSR